MAGSLLDVYRKSNPALADVDDLTLLNALAQVKGFSVRDAARYAGVNTKSGFFGGINDLAVEGVNAAAGALGTIPEMISPGNRFSQGIQDFQRMGERTQSLDTQIAKQELGQALESDNLGTQLSGVGNYIWENPGLSAAQAIGNFVVPGAAIKGVRGAAALAGATEKGQKIAGLTAGSATSAMMSGGDAAGSAYDTVMNSPELAHIPEAQRHEMAVSAARKASVAPAAVGAVGGLIGAEGALGRGASRSILRTAGGEFLSEAFEEGTTQLSANLAAQEFVPSVPTWRGVAGAAALGGVLGAGTGAAVGALTRPGGSLLAGANDNVPGSNPDDATAAAIGGSTTPPAPGPYTPPGTLPTPPGAEFTPPGVTPAAPTPPATPAAAGTTPTAPVGAAPATTPPSAPTGTTATPTAPAGTTQQKGKPAPVLASEDEINDVITRYGVTPLADAERVWKMGDRTIIGQPKRDEILNEIALADRNKSEARKQVEQAAMKAGLVKFKSADTAKKILKALDKLMESVSLQDVDSVETAAKLLDLQIKDAFVIDRADQNSPRMQLLGQLYEAITGDMSPAWKQATEEIQNPASTPTLNQVIVDNVATRVGDASPAPATNAAPATGSAPTAPTVDNTATPAPTTAPAATATTTEPTPAPTTAPAAPTDRQGLLNEAWSTYSDPEDSLTLDDLTAAEQGRLEAAQRSNTLNQVEFNRITYRARKQKQDEKKAAKNKPKTETKSLAPAQRKSLLTELMNAVFNPNDVGILMDALANEELSQSEIAKRNNTKQQRVSEVLAKFGYDHKEKKFTGDGVKNFKRLLNYAEARGISQEQLMELFDYSNESTTTDEDVTPGEEVPEVEDTNVDKGEVTTSDDVTASEEATEEEQEEDPDGELGEGEADEEVSEADGGVVDEREENGIRKKKGGSKTQANVSDSSSAQQQVVRILEEIDRRAQGLSKPKNEAEFDKEAPKNKDRQGRLVGFQEWVQNAPLARLQERLNQLIAESKKEEKTRIKKAEEEAKNKSNRYGKGDLGAVRNPYTASELIEEIKNFIRADILGRKLVVVNTIGDLARMGALTGSNKVKKLSTILALNGAYGVAVDGTAYLIADRIEKGTGRAKFLHEVGVHLGLENLLPSQTYDKLVQQIFEWAAESDGIEGQLARNAVQRAVLAEGEDSDALKDEVLAYFVEEAVEAGIDPTAATMKASAPLREWFRTLWAAFKVAVRKLGFKVETLTPQDVVDLAFGAARLEMNGLWHGTAASFRRFNHLFMGSGEGAQAFGWGSYLAQRVGIAKGYWQRDIKDKRRNRVELSFDGKSLNDALTELRNRTNSGSPLEERAVERAVAAVYEQINAKSNMPVYEAMAVLNEALGDKNLSAADRKLSAAAYGLLSDLDFVKRFKGDYIRVEPKGSLMRVDVPISDDELLDWFKPMSEQSDTVKAAVEVIAKAHFGKKYNQEYFNRQTNTGEKFYESFSTFLGSDKKLSEKLNSLGVKGVKFYDDSSRNPMSRAYVTFAGAKFKLDQLFALSREERRIRRKENDSQGPLSDKWIQYTTLRHVLQDGYEETLQDAKDKFARYIDIFLESRRDRHKRDVEYYRQRVRDEEVMRAKYPSLQRKDVPRPSDFDEAAVRAELEEEHNDHIAARTIKFLKESKDLISTGEDEATYNLVIFDDKNIFRVGAEESADPEKMRFGINRAGSSKAIKDKINSLPENYRGPLWNIFDTIVDKARKVAPTFAFTEDLANLAKDKLPSAAQYVSLINRRMATRVMYERKVDKVLEQFQKLDKKNRDLVNSLLMDSTMAGEWPYDPGISKAKVGNALKVRFDNVLSSDAQKVVRAVFDHGRTMLQEMKNAVIQNTSSEFDALIADAKQRGDTAQEQKLVADKAKSLKEYETLMNVKSSAPYAPLKRFGNYVVVATSKEYQDTETKAKAGDEDAKKALSKMERDENHYLVSFRETWGEARGLQRSLERNYPYAKAFEKDQVANALYSRTDVADLFERFRTMVDENMDEKTSAPVRKLMADLRLSLLSEASARQAERRRRKIAGADTDMMRAFASQGRATAHFIASLTNSESVYEHLRNMRKEAGRDAEARRYFNEFLKRHAMGLEYTQPGFVDKALRFTSMHMLLTNPAYYLQNSTQPILMSMPYMAGKYGEGRTFAALVKAYKEVGSLISKGGFNESTYPKLPDDVRAAVEELVNRGRIDISLDFELGRWRSDGQKGLMGRVTGKVQSMAETLEAINRVVTAIAAYRLSGDVEYADEVIYRTHGSYSAFNAPRFMRGGVGKIATQFRKFQLIQLSLMAKLFNSAFRNADPMEKKIARKQLVFTLSHTFAVGGVMGLPGYTALSWLISSIFGDPDEPDDAEQAMRKEIGDELSADLLLKGVPAALGVDMSGKLGMGNMLSVLPYNDVDLSRDSYTQAFTALAGGPFFGGIMPRTLDGLGLMRSGNYWKGLELMLPTGLANAARGVRFASEGVTQRNDDVVLSADEISFGTAMLQALGLPTTLLTARQSDQKSKIVADEFYRKRTTEMKRKYVRAQAEGDTEALAEVREEWANLQEARVRNGYARQPYSTLLKAPAEKVKREKNTAGGVQFRKENRRFVEEAAET